jgi:hypothetical protein
MSESDDKPLKKKKTPIKKEASNISSKDLQAMLREVLAENLDDYEEKKNLDVDAMISTIEEFLRSFIIIGYSMKNEPIVITNAKSQLDADALYTALCRLFSTIHGDA